MVPEPDMDDYFFIRGILNGICEKRFKAIHSNGSLACAIRSYSFLVISSKLTCIAAPGKRFCVISTDRKTNSSRRTQGYSFSAVFLSDSNNKFVIPARCCSWRYNWFKTFSYCPGLSFLFSAFSVVPIIPASGVRSSWEASWTNSF